MKETLELCELQAILKILLSLLLSGFHLAPILLEFFDFHPFSWRVRILGIRAEQLLDFVERGWKRVKLLFPDLFGFGFGFFGRG